MQDVVSVADRWTPGGRRGGLAGLATAVRALAAVVLLGVALLLVALVNQTAASADSLPTPSADGQDDRHPNTPSALGSGSVISPNAVSSGSDGAYQDYMRSLARGAVLTAELPPSAAADLQLTRHTGARGQDTAGSGMPGPDAGHLQAPQLGEAVRWGTPKVVAQPPRSTGEGTGDGQLDGSLSAPKLPAGTLTVAAAQVEAQPPSSSDPSPPSAYRRLSFYLFTNGILQQAEDLRGLVVGDRKDLPTGTMMKAVDGKAAFINEQIAAARKLAGATTIEAGVKVADAPAAALEEVKGAIRGFDYLSGSAEEVAKLIVKGEDTSTTMLRGRARSAVMTADTADHRLATLQESDPDDGYPRTPDAIVSPVSKQAVSLAAHTKESAREWGSQTAWVEDVEREADRLLNDAETHATNAKGLYVTPTLEQAAKAAKAAAASLRTQADFAQQVAGVLESRSKGIQDLAKRTADQAERINVEVFGGGATGVPITPVGPRRPREQGTELPTPGPDPDTPVTQHAHLDGESDPATPVATVQGGNRAVPEPGGEHVDAGHEQPIGALDASNGTSPFDNSGMFADV